MGRDKNGNSYYESNQGKRWVMYRSFFEPTTIPPKWHIWLHYTNNEVPVNDTTKRKIKYTSNFGTKDMYDSNQKMKNYYKNWNPNN